MLDCQFDLSERRRTFWATQPDACGATYNYCQNIECGSPGLNINRTTEGNTIDTSNFVRGLVLNILMTNGKKEETECGLTPGNRGGHWSDSFTGASSGSSLRNIPKTYSIRETANLIRAHIQYDMQKLVNYGVAERVEVTAEYQGNNNFLVNISIYGNDKKITVIPVGGQRQNNMWVWNS